jgi:hypothetical protein
VVADRTRAAVGGWLEVRSRDWLAQVATVSLDPWRGYATALVASLGHARVVDHFHAIKLANAAVDQVRRRTQQATLGHRGRKPDPLYRIRKLLVTAAEQLTSRGWVRRRAGLTAGDLGGEVVAAWQGKELRRAGYAAVGLPAARAALERFDRWQTAWAWPSCRGSPAPSGPGRPRSSPSIAPMAAPLRGGMANFPDRETARPLTTLSTPTGDRDLHGCWVACRW